MLSVCATREQRTQWSGQNTCCSETMKRPKVSQGTDGEGTRCCFKDLDAVLWVMGKLWRLIHSDIVLQLVSPLGRTFSHSPLFFNPPLGILTIPVMLVSLSLNRNISPIWLGPHSPPYLAITFCLYSCTMGLKSLHPGFPPCHSQPKSLTKEEGTGAQSGPPQCSRPQRSL